MRFLKTVFAITIQNFRKWITDYRIWVIGIILLILIHENVNNLVELSEKAGVESSLWLYPFLYSQYHQRLIFTLPIILLFCNAPFVDDNSLFIISRSGKLVNSIGQIIYVIVASFVYYIFILTISLLLLIPDSTLSADWGKVFNIIAYTSASTNEGYHFLDASGFVMTYFTPLKATCFTLLLSSIAAIFIGLIVYAFNLITQTKYVGCIIGSVIIIFSSFVEAFGTKDMLKFSPISWNTLNNIDVGGFTSNPSFLYCILVYLTSIMVMISIILLISRKRMIDVMK